MTRFVGLLGWPVKHSLSPAMHNAAFRALGLDWRYDALPIQSDDHLVDRVTRLLREGYCGFNVTIPHKRAVMRLPQIAEVESSVEAIGAANTLILLPDGELRATNTDWQGFADDLLAHGASVAGVNCLVLGTGGSAQAVAYALRQMGAISVTFISRKPKTHSNITGYGKLKEVLHVSPLLIVNCTPVGMHPNSDASPWPTEIPFPPRATLYDLVYNPATTRLIDQARNAGAYAIGGLGMLVRQGALSFQQWTGIAPPLDIMESAARDALGM